MQNSLSTTNTKTTSVNPVSKLKRTTNMDTLSKKSAASAVGSTFKKSDSKTFKPSSSTAKSFENKKLTTTTTTTKTSPQLTPKHKSSNFINWFKTNNKNNNNNNNNNSNNNSNNNNNRNGSSGSEENSNNNIVPLWMRPSARRSNSPDVTSFPDFRGVQNLRLLWNKRISANAEAVRLYNNFSKSKLTNSVSCLINEKEVAIELNTSRSNTLNTSLNKEFVGSFNSFQRFRPNRAQSLHDCRPFDNDNDNDNNNVNNNEDNEIDILHRLKDNFYKYKTAEQTAAHLVRDTARARVKPKNDTRSSSASSSAKGNFPAFTKCESGASHINWLKRYDIINGTRNPKAELENCATSINDLKESKMDREMQNIDTVMEIKDKKSLTTITTTPKTQTSEGTTTVTTVTTETVPESLAILSELKNFISCCDNGFGSATTATATTTATVAATSTMPEQNKVKVNVNVNVNVNSNGIIERKEYNQNCSNSGSPASSATDTNANAMAMANIPPEHNNASSLTLLEQKRGTSRSKNRTTHTADNCIPSGSKRSANSSPTSIGSRKNTTASSAKRSASSNGSSSGGNVRKYSFKTHSRNCLIPRKMMHGGHRGGDNNSASVAMNGGAINSSSAVNGGSNITGSIVAKLTQQFNEIIQKDKTLLEEVKRKNGVLLTRGGHVYKVIDTTDPTQQQKISLKRNNSNASPSISRTNSRRSKESITKPSTIVSSSNLSSSSDNQSSVVKKTIKKFEEKFERPAVSVPVPVPIPIPVKNVQKNQEPKTVHSENSIGEVGNANGKRNNLTLPLTSSTVQNESIKTTETQTTMTMKKQVHTLILTAPTLEVVKEEARTPQTESEVQISEIVEKKNEKNSCCRQTISPSSMKNFNNLEPKHPGHIFTPAYSSNLDKSAKVFVPRNHATKSIIADCSETSAKNSDIIEVSAQQLYRKKCSNIYDKFRLFSSLENINGNSSGNGNANFNGNDKVDKAIEPDLESTKQNNNDEESSNSAVSKLYDALEACNEKIKDIVTDSTIMKSSHPIVKNNSNVLVVDNDDFEKRILPNNSFIHNSCTKQVSNNSVILPQAVNVTLINSIEGEQMIMEQKELQCTGMNNVETNATAIDSSLLSTSASASASTSSSHVDKYDETMIYESIITNEILLRKTENDENARKSFLFKCQQRMQTNVTEPLSEPPTDDIYQTVEEVQQQQQQQHQHQQQPQHHQETTSFNDYESIAGSCEQAPEKISTIATNAEDGYEICEPPPPVTTIAPSTSSTTTTTTTTTTTSTSSTMVRNTNDELPELPKPKRRLPKSPIPRKRSSTSIKASKTVVAGVNTIIQCPSDADTTQQSTTFIEDIDEQHYYADDENIYDTIKGSHCYESLNANNTNTNNQNNNNNNNRRLQKTLSIASSSSSLPVEKNKDNFADSVSLTSNCYESITHYRRIVFNSSSISVGGVAANVENPTGSNNGSTLTISSDHKTNSLYEAPLETDLMQYNGSKNPNRILIGSSSESAKSTNENVENRKMKVSNENIIETQQQQRGGDANTSDNSDEWIDISESDGDDDGEGKQQFIVVRERQKIHRSPDWSRRVRDKRLQNTKSESCIDDDSDHYYETLSPLGGKRHSMQQPMQQQKSCNEKGFENIKNDHLKVGKLERNNRNYYGLSNGLGNRVTSDDYDSFDSSIDEVFDGGQNGLRKDYNDSGVDIRNVKLPEPPPTTNQVYAIVKKLKKFISNKKSPSSSSSVTGSSKSNIVVGNNSQQNQKLYENSSQFYVEDNIYRSTPKSKSMPKLNVKKSTGLPTLSNRHDDYENSDFHTSTNVDVEKSSTKPLSNSERNLSGLQIYQSNPNQYTEVATLRSKAKSSGKSLRSRIQKSFAGSSTENKNTPSSLTSTRSTFYLDPNTLGYGELDSGFSEKASSGDLPVPASSESQKFSTVARKSKRESKSAQRRRTVIGLRPNDPPPPPPDDVTLAKIKEKASTTFWYAECGVFKNGNAMPNEPLDENSLNTNTNKNSIYNQNCTLTGNSSSWYAEAGLYQTSGVSVASSSGSSGVSTGNEAGLGDELAHSFFMNEPLYQIYSAAKLESISRDMEDNDSSTDGYEEIGQNANIANSNSKSDEENQRRPRLSALQLVGPKVGPARTLWSEIPEVINSCVLMTLTSRERALQEAKFEILTSEASYLKSLNLLRSHFMNHPIFRDTNVVSSRDRKALFSNITPVHECSERLLTELESCWQDNIMLLGLSNRIYSIAEKSFRVYIDFCEHQGRMDRTLRRLKDTKGIFCQNLELLESSPICCGLNLHSFLMLPMQRITRLPLLIDAVFSKVSPNDDEYESWKMTLAIMNKIVAQCNEAANRCEQAYEVERISRQLEFPTTIRALAIAPVGVAAPGSKPRYLVKKGELTHLVWRGDDAKLTFGRKITKSMIFAFLFSDLLVLAKRKSEEQFTVFDYCPRNMLTIQSGNALPQLPIKDLNQTGKNLILMTLLENYEQKTVELFLSCPSVSEQERWLQTMRPPESETPGEKLYEEWDCPQVITKHAYKANEPDALDLDVGDVVNVMRKLPDGWYQGERIRDGATGWFPGTYTEEVNSAHVRARNLKQRHRLLTFTATYLESRKQKF